MTSTLSASSVASTAEMSVPSSIVPPLGSRETEVWSGTARPACAERLARAEDGGLDLEDVLRGLDDQEVGAAVDQALGLLGEDLDELAEADLAQRRVVRGGEVAGRADRAGDEAVLADRAARDLRGLAVDLVRVLAEAPLVELQAGGLERVRLHDLGADLDHGAVEVLDDVGAVEDERLVRAAGQLVVLLEREVELLERGAHAPVEDDDAVTGGCQVVAHRRGSLANLDKVVARLGCADCNPDVKPVRRPARRVSR